MNVNRTTYFDFDNLSKTLECPAYLTPLTDAIHLHPCSHKVSELALEQMRKEPTLKCPVCRTLVVSAYPDHSFRSLVSMVTDLQGKKSWGAFVDQVQSTNPIIDNYPGNPAIFSTKGGWKKSDPHLNIRTMTFTSETSDSLLKNIEAYKHPDGEISIGIMCDSTKKSAFTNYLKEIGIRSSEIYSNNTLALKTFNEPDAIVNYYRFLNHEDMKKIYQILVQNNHFPQEEISLLNSFVESGTWRTEELSSLSATAPAFVPQGNPITPSLSATAPVFVPQRRSSLTANVQEFTPGAW